MNPGPVAVIDVGSNSIKLLVAARGPDGGIATLHTRTLDARISAGLSRARPQLGAEGMSRGLEAIRTLLADAERFSANVRALVATSAVRDASNGSDFSARVREATGDTLRILSGEEEARLIGRGLTCDPALRACRDFTVFDLGGGSLECLVFRDRAVRQMVSLPLGCVRLTEKFVPHPELPFAPEAAAQIAAHVRTTLAEAGFAFPTEAGAACVATGGTVATVRAILGACAHLEFDATSPVVTVQSFRDLLADLGARPLDTRRQVAGLPPARADVFPAALATLIAVAETGGIAAFTHSLFNLRYGLAAEALGAEG